MFVNMSTTKCLHCQSNIVASNDDGFCCMGCKSAYHIIDKLNLKKYYEQCNNIYNKFPLKSDNIKSDLNFIPFVLQPSDETNKINLHIEGIQCGSCIWLIENTLKSQLNILEARVNLSTKRLNLIWQGDPNIVNDYVDLIQSLGYKVAPYEQNNYTLYNEDEEKNLLIRVAVSGFTFVQLMMITMGIWLNGELGTYTTNLLNLFAAIVAIPSIIYSGMPFFKSAIRAAKHARSNMDIPISIAIVVTTIISIYEYTIFNDYTYFDSAIMLIFALLIGRYLDKKARNKAREKAHQLMLLQGKVAICWSNGKMQTVAVNKLQIDDIIFVSTGERISADGIIIEGESEIDNSLITGESIPCKLGINDYVFSGTINLTAPLKVRVTKLSENTLLSEIIQLIENAEQGRAKYVMLADKVSSIYTYVVLGMSVFTFFMWYMKGNDLNICILNAIAVLIITCPCALGLAVPIVQIISSTKLMANGVIVKSKNALECIANIDTIVFDKTGILTYPQLKINNLQQIPLLDQQLIKSMCIVSKHPLCIAVKDSIICDVLGIEVVENKGMGLKAFHEGEELKLGNRTWCNVEINCMDSYSEIWFKKGNRLPIRIEFSNILRAESKSIIDALKLKFDVWIASGDRYDAVESVARQLDVTQYKYELTPNQKYNFIMQLNDAGKKVLMIGDGLNDSAAMKKAHVSFSPTTSIDITQNHADVVFQNDLSSIIKCIDIAYRSEYVVKQNFALAIIYNVVSIPIAMLGYITPLIAAIAMSISSICVVLNSLRLKK